MKRITILPPAAKALRRHRAEAPPILRKLGDYAADPASQANNMKSLKGSVALRLRVGDFRIVFEETADEIVVTKIAPRGSAYD